MNKLTNKLKLTSCQNEMVEVVMDKVNDKYFFMSKILVKLGENEFEEIELRFLPKVIREHILNKFLS